MILTSIILQCPQKNNNKRVQASDLSMAFANMNGCRVKENQVKPWFCHFQLYDLDQELNLSFLDYKILMLRGIKRKNERMKIKCISEYEASCVVRAP